MDSSSGGEKDGGDGETSGSVGPNLHDHSDLLIPNPSFSSPPGSVSSSTSSSMMMNITSPCSDYDLHNKQMDCQMTSPQQPISCGGTDNPSVGQQMDYAISPEEGQRPEGSPPNVVVDDSPLQPCMDRNKESLKVKLQLRRPMNQLVEQGILPPPKTPAAFASQRVRLERARMGDLLRAKIQQRPARQELIRQHILEDVDSRVDPSLADKQRRLKRARLADSLNDHLIHRPGPLELVQKNILHAPDADIDKAIKEGIVNFKATSEGHVPGPSLPNKYIVNEDDSSSDISSPAGTPDASSSGPNTEANTPISKQSSDPAICLPSAVTASEPCEVTLQPAKTNKSETVPPPPPPPPPPLPPQLILTTSAISTSPAQVQQITAPATIFQVTTPAAVIPPPPPLPTINHIPATAPQTIVLSDGAVRDLLPQLQSAGFQLAAAHVQKPPSQSSSSLGKTRSSKKSSKSKSQPKARTIKFHEYKGPSSCQPKGGSSSSASSSLSAQSNAESSYDLLLKQQQMFLHWQIEWQHKYPQILLPAAPKLAPGSSGIGSSTNNSKTLSSFPVTTLPASLCTNLLNSNNQQSSQQPTITVAASTSNNGNASPKTIPVVLAPKVAEIAPKPPPSNETPGEPKSLSNDVSVPSPASSTCSSTTDKSLVKTLSLNNIGEWKVNDLKAELKKRSLPVSGSKSQLIDRLKAAAAKEVASEAKSVSTSIKMEVMSADENSSEAMMDTTSNGNDEKAKSNPNVPATSIPPATAIVIQTPSNGTSNPEGPSFITLADILAGKVNGAALQSILSLFGAQPVANANNNVDSNGGVVNNNPAADNNLKNIVIPNAKVINQLPITALVNTAAKSAAANNDTSVTNSLEQQKQILELQKEVSLSQQKLAQQKDSKNIGPQEHRQLLRNHIQQKQKYQSQMQNLMQLQTQQAEQKKQQEQAQAQLLIINRSGTNTENNTGSDQQRITISNNILPVTIVNPQEVSASNHWLPNGQQGGDQRNENGETPSLDDLVQTIDTKDIPKLEPQTKSQMVDDVLEILIRTGELPPSAAQDPHPKTLISSRSQIGGLDTIHQQSSKKTAQPPPPPPPLPPPSFSVMLPTSIPFSRHQTTSNPDFLTFGMANSVKTEENLSKDAEAILRISEDLSNYGESREAEAAAAAAGMKLVSGGTLSNTPSDLGFFSRTGSQTHSGDSNKDYDLSTSNTTATNSMDLGFNDTHSVSLHSSSNPKAQLVNHQNHFSNSPFDFSAMDQQTSANHSLKSHVSDHHNDHAFIDDLHLDIQMDTDYSDCDWLDTLCNSTSNGVSSASSTTFPNIDHHNHHPQHLQNSQQADASKKFTSNLLNHNNNFSNSANQTNNSSLFSSIMDESNHQNQHHNPHHSQQRDPLLSSRSFATGLASMNSLPFREQLHHNNHHFPNSFLFSSTTVHNNMNPSFHGPSSLGSTSSGTTLMDTDFDDMSSSTCHSTKKSDNNIISNNVIMPEMPSTTTHNITTPITTSSINDNFLWDF